MQRSELIAKAKDKWKKEQLVEQAKAKWDSENESKDNSSIPEEIETGIRSYVEGTTLGLSEPITSALNSLVGHAIDSGFDSKDIKEFRDKFFDMHKIKDAYKSDVERRKSLKSDNLKSAVSGEIAGAITPGGIASKIGKEVATGARGFVNLLPNADKALKAKGLGGAAARASQSVVQGGAIGGITEGLKEVAEIPTGFIDPKDSNIPGSILSGGTFGGKIQGAIEVPGLIAKGGKSVLAAMSGVRPNIVNEYLKRGASTRNAKSVADAKSILDEGTIKAQTELKGQKLDFSDRVIDAIENLKNKVVQGSKDAYKILDKEKGEIDTASIRAKITQVQKSMQPVKGAPPTSDSAESAYNVLSKYREKFNQYPKKISLSEAKHMLQQMDGDINYAQQAGEFGTSKSNAIYEIRKSLDKSVKLRSPKYANKMEKVSSDAELLEEMSKNFGSNEKVLSKIERFGTLKSDLQIQALKNLQDSTRNELMNPLRKIQQAQPIMSMNPASSQSFMTSIFNKSSLENKKKLNLLSKLSGEDFFRMVENTGLKNAFSKEFNAGSTNVNLWTVLGSTGLLAAGGGAVQGAAGAFTGAIIGSMVRFYGPAVAKTVLDGVSKIQGIPTIKKLNKTLQGVPPEIVDRLKSDLIRGLQIHDQETNIVIPQSEYINTLRDIDGASNISTIQKAKAIDSMNRYGSVPTGTMRQIVLDDGSNTGAMPPVRIESNRKPEEKGERIESIADYIRKQRNGEF